MNSSKKIAKILSVILALTMILSLGACSKSSDQAEDSSTTTAADGKTTTAAEDEEDADAEDEEDADADEEESTDAEDETEKETTTKKKSYTTAEALNLYKTAANKVKGSSATATRTKEVIKTISGSIPSAYQTFGFKEGTDTEKKVVSGSSDLKSDFPVEGESYVCNLSASDVKSATVSQSGSNTVVTIYVKDDDAGTYSRSSKCVSTISIPIGTWTCKGVILRGTIDKNGNLVNLYYKMPTYVTQGSDAFAFSLEQYWTIAW